MNERISDDAAEAVLRGRAPDGRHDLVAVAEVVVALRSASFEAPPRPSAELALRLDLERAARLSTDRQHASTAAVAHPAGASTPRRGRRRVAPGAVASLGLAAKIAIGAAAAVAAAAVGVAGAGAAGAGGGLPAPAQEVFDQVTGHPGGEHVSETGIEKSEFGQKAAEEARQKARSSARRHSRMPRRSARPDSTRQRRSARPDSTRRRRRAGPAPSMPTARARPDSRLPRIRAEPDPRSPARRRRPRCQSRAAAMGLNGRRSATETPPPPARGVTSPHVRSARKE